jgi:hypothetical protein
MHVCQYCKRGYPDCESPPPVSGMAQSIRARAPYRRDRSAYAAATAAPTPRSSLKWSRTGSLRHGGGLRAVGARGEESVRYRVYLESLPDSGENSILKEILDNIVASAATTAGLPACSPTACAAAAGTNDRPLTNMQI